MAVSTICIDDPRTPEVAQLLGQHLRFTSGHTPATAVYALDLTGLLDPAVTLYGYRESGRLLAIGALRELGAGHAELKSMHTAEAARGRGIGRRLLTQLMQLARDRGINRLSLETGTGPAFAPARALYLSAGFRACAPFADYQPGPHNTFLTRELAD